MYLTIIGLGKMGLNIAIRLKEHSIDVKGFDIDKISRNNAEKCGIETYNNFFDIFNQTEKEQIIWVMVPTDVPRDKVLKELYENLNKGNIIIDGTNSYYKTSIAYAKLMCEKGIDFLDAGVSGGIWGLERGYCLMVGGKEEIYKKCENIFKALSCKNGFIYTGESGSGHFVKMVHNAIEYGMMQSIAEGLQLLKEGHYKNLDIPVICNNWNNGSIISSFLMEMAANALNKEKDIDKISSFVADTGEGKWAALEMIEQKIPGLNLVQSLFTRFLSQKEDNFFLKVLALMRKEFGGHNIKHRGD